MNSKYLNDSKVAVSFLTVLVSLLSYTFLARRSAAFTFFGFMIASWIFAVVGRSNKMVFKLFPLAIVTSIFMFLLWPENILSLTEKVRERAFDDTRSELFAAFFLEMDNFTFFGKGMNGTYYYPMEESPQDDGIVYAAEVYRNNIENGYLQLFLNGGVVNVVLFILVLVPAAWNGIFMSSNLFVKTCGTMILLWLLDMFFYGLPTLSLHYVLIWICVGICFKSSIRERTDDEIISKFEKHNLN
jgi:hypothetical protein